jgi:glycosyltransferase involved in cell wall biosynthesis
MARQPKVAIVHDWLVGGGAERVVSALHELYPDAPIYTSYCTPEWRKRLDGKVVTGWLQHFGKLRKFLAVPRMRWFSHLDFKGYDLVISSSGNGEAMGVRVPEGTVHIAYCHTPTHYYWRHYDRYLARPGFGVLDPLARLGLRLLLGPLRKWDYNAAQRPDFFIANSSHIQKDIKTYYGRDSVIIHPPVDISRFTVGSVGKRQGFVTAGRQVPLKYNDIIVEAATKLGLPLTVVGTGPEHERLKKLAGPTVTFTGYVTDADMPKYLAGAQAFLFASFEDFGIIPVEAMASGTPVIAYKAGGTPDYIEPGVTGLFFNEQTVDSLAATLKGFDPKQFDPNVLRKKAEQFSPEVFKAKIREFIASVVK